jgi:hypothetical protein
MEKVLPDLQRKKDSTQYEFIQPYKTNPGISGSPPLMGASTNMLEKNLITLPQMMA